LGIVDRTFKKKLPENFFMLLNPAEHIQQQLFWYGYYEKELGDLIKKVLRPGDVFLDIGANIGYFSLLVSNNVPNARVISFEPVQYLFQKLEENISVNNIKNIMAIKAAAGEIDEEKEIFISGSDNLGMSSFQQPENYSGKKEKVKVVRIDDWFHTSHLSKVDVIKLDVEGSELAALKGMNDILTQFKPLLIIEINCETLSMFGLTPSNINNYLNQLNFDGFIILENARLAALKENAKKQTTNVLFIHKDKKELYGEYLINDHGNT